MLLVELGLFVLYPDFSILNFFASFNIRLILRKGFRQSYGPPNILSDLNYNLWNTFITLLVSTLRVNF